MHHYENKQGMRDLGYEGGIIEHVTYLSAGPVE